MSEMEYQVLSYRPQEMPDWLNNDGVMPLNPASYYRQFEWNQFRVWCHLYSRYGVVTKELVTTLKDLIGQRSAIEIGSGAGDLAYHLQIPATDSRIMENPVVAELYRQNCQPVVKYPSFVEKLEALEAIEKYQPQVVIAQWVTEWIDPNLPPPFGGGSIYGVKEELLLDTGVTYILVGNDYIHGFKSIMRRPHETIRMPGILSRSKNQEKNAIYIWKGSR